jgi:YkoY family integral membrane protein
MLDQILDPSLYLGIQTFLKLLILVFLEAVLSADNALALAALSQGLEDSKLQRQALNIGLALAYVLRISLILTATWVIQFWQVELLGAAYLLLLSYQYFTSGQSDGDNQDSRFESLLQIIPLIALTDLAFSLDSVTTAIALSRRTWLILTGATIGIIALRFMAELFIRWLDEFVHLEDAGYLTVALVGWRLLMRVINHQWVPPEWLMIVAIALIFIWGFSERTLTNVLAETENSEVQDQI